MGYRKNYLTYYELESRKDFEVHHLNFDRSNNEIYNLVLIPKKLHRKIHNLVNELRVEDKTKITINICDSCSVDCFLPKLVELSKYLYELEYWKMLKNCNYFTHDGKNVDLDIELIKQWERMHNGK